MREPGKPLVGDGTWGFSEGGGMVWRSLSHSPGINDPKHRSTTDRKSGTVLLKGRQCFNRLCVIGK